MNVRTKLRCDVTSAASARRFVADVLSSRGFANGCIESAVLLTSEIVTNAIVHARSDVDLVVVADPPMARVEVYDHDPSPPVRLEPDPDSTRGRGMQVIDTVAEAWGVDRLDVGKCVWFELRS